MYPREHVNLFVLLVEQLFELACLGLEDPHALLQGLGVAPGEGATAELVAGLALKADIGALCAAGADSVAAYLLGSTSVAGLGDAGLAVGPDFDHFHGQNAGHGGGCVLRVDKCRGNYWSEARGRSLTGCVTICHASVPASRA